MSGSIQCDEDDLHEAAREEWRNLYVTKTGYREFGACVHASESMALLHIAHFFQEWRRIVIDEGDGTVEFPSGYTVLFSQISHATPVQTSE